MLRSGGEQLRWPLFEALEGMSSFVFSMGVVLTPIFSSIGAVDSDGVGCGFGSAAAALFAVVVRFEEGVVECDVTEQLLLCVAAGFCETIRVTCELQTNRLRQ